MTRRYNILHGRLACLAHCRTTIPQSVRFVTTVLLGRICSFTCRIALSMLKPVRTPVAILGSLGVCIYVPASRHWLISYSPIHLN